MLFLVHAFRIYYPIAVTVGFCTGVVANYLLHKRFTFSDFRRLSVREFTKFVLIVILNYEVTLIAVYELHGTLGFGLVIARLTALNPVYLIGFTLVRRLFRNRGATWAQ